VIAELMRKPHCRLGERDWLITRQAKTLLCRWCVARQNNSRSIVAEVLTDGSHFGHRHDAVLAGAKAMACRMLHRCLEDASGPALRERPWPDAGSLTVVDGAVTPQNASAMRTIQRTAGRGPSKSSRRKPRPIFQP
jgi:hypothetical protein